MYGYGNKNLAKNISVERANYFTVRAVRKEDSEEVRLGYAVYLMRDKNTKRDGRMASRSYGAYVESKTGNQMSYVVVPVGNEVDNGEIDYEVGEDNKTGRERLFDPSLIVLARDYPKDKVEVVSARKEVVSKETQLDQQYERPSSTDILISVVDFMRQASTQQNEIDLANDASPVESVGDDENN